MNFLEYMRYRVQGYIEYEMKTDPSKYVNILGIIEPIKFKLNIEVSTPKN